MEITFKAPGGNWKYSKKANISINENTFFCSRISNPNFMDPEAKSLFEEEGQSIEKAWIEDFSIKQSLIKDVIVNGYSKTLPALILGLVIGVGMTAFSFFTDSLYWWNALIYFIVLAFSAFIFIKGNTTVKIVVMPVKATKKYEFQIIALGNCPELINLGREFRDIIQNED